MEQTIIDKLMDWKETDLEAKIPMIKMHNELKFQKLIKTVFSQMDITGLEGEWLVSVLAWKWVLR